MFVLGTLIFVDHLCTKVNINFDLFSVKDFLKWGFNYTAYSFNMCQSG